jgi:uncharacterized protein YraI
MKHVLVSLWLTGAVLFLISTSLSAVNLFGENDRSKPNNDQRSAQPAPSQPAVQHPKPAVAPPETQAIPSLAAERSHAISPTVVGAPPETQALPSLAAERPHAISPTVVGAPPETQALPSLAAERPHAISPDQPSSEPPAGYELPGHPHIALPTPTAEPSKIATLRLNSAANIRSGPSLTAPIIGTAAVGAELQVTAYDADWVQFIDPSSGKTGWVHSQSVEADTTSKAAAVAATKPTEEAPQVEPPKPKLAKNAKKRAKGVAVSKRQLPSEAPKAHVALPSAEEFVPPQRRPRVILERRRMLREGLMSPGFRPPR